MPAVIPLPQLQSLIAEVKTTRDTLRAQWETDKVILRQHAEQERQRQASLQRAEQTLAALRATLEFLHNVADRD